MHRTLYKQSPTWHDLNLWPFVFELNCFMCLNSVENLLGHRTSDRRFTTVRGPNFTKLGDDTGRSSHCVALHFCFRVLIHCCIFKQLKVEWCWKRRQDSHFLTTLWILGVVSEISLYHCWSFTYDRTSGIHLMAMHFAAAQRWLDKKIRRKRGNAFATVWVRHSEGPPFRRSGPPKAVTNPNPNPNPIWSAIVISWTWRVCVSVCYSCTLVQDLRSGGPSEWRTAYHLQLEAARTTPALPALIITTSCQAWSCWIYPLPYYSVFCYITLRCDLDLWSLTLNICMYHLWCDETPCQI